MVKQNLYNFLIRLFTITAIVLIFVILIFYADPEVKIFPLVDYVFLLICLLSTVIQYLKAGKFFPFVKENLMLLFIFIAYIWVYLLDIGLFFTEPVIRSQAFHANVFKVKIIVRLAVILAYIAFFWKNLKRIIVHIKLKPAQSFSLGFIVVILFGAFLLMLPASHATPKKLPVVDALFTSTSAMCVTGLIVVDTATFFSTFGKTVIMLLIQIGGLGVMTLSAFIIILSGSKMTLREKSQALAILDQDSVTVLKKLLKLIIISTLIIELIAAICIYIFVGSKMSLPFEEKIFFSIFHSVSAFCNAGFSTLSDSLVGFQGNIVMNTIIMTLIFFGGIGFPVLFNIKNKISQNFIPKTKRKAQRIHVQSRLVIIISFILIIIGTIAFIVFEYSNVLVEMSTGKKIVSSLFQSVTTRTAGFNTVDISKLSDPTILLFIILMFIGASPSSTGGGIKTTTVIVLWLALGAVIKNKKRITIYGRTITDEIVRKAASLILIAFILVFTSTIIISWIEKIDMLKVLFEATSAFATVGLSMGITAKLSTFSKYLIIVLMFVGRIGPLNILQAFFKQADREKILYPEEKIMIG